MRLAIEQRIELGKKRIVNILRKHGVATLKILEQKISDAGPSHQRVDPHILTRARTQLQREGILFTRESKQQHQWHYLAETESAIVEQRYQELSALHSQTEAKDFGLRMGQTAEIAVLRALQDTRSQFSGHFSDLDQHDDSALYTKRDPEAVNGVPIRGGRLDFVVFRSDAGPFGIEVKNKREWVYPDRSIMKDLLGKCLQVDAVPVIIARRISYSTFSVLTECGVVVHQQYNQLYPYADAALAERVREKRALGYFDIRVGNMPDARLLTFLGRSLPMVAPRARQKFDEQKGIVQAFADSQMSYKEFVLRIRGRWEDAEEAEWEEE